MPPTYIMFARVLSHVHSQVEIRTRQQLPCATMSLCWGVDVASSRQTDIFSTTHWLGMIQAHHQLVNTRERWGVWGGDGGEGHSSTRWAWECAAQEQAICFLCLLWQGTPHTQTGAQGSSFRGMWARRQCGHSPFIPCSWQPGWRTCRSYLILLWTERQYFGLLALQTTFLLWGRHIIKTLKEKRKEKEERQRAPTCTTTLCVASRQGALCAFDGVWFVRRLFTAFCSGSLATKFQRKIWKQAECAHGCYLLQENCLLHCWTLITKNS